MFGQPLQPPSPDFLAAMRAALPQDNPPPIAPPMAAPTPPQGPLAALMTGTGSMGAQGPSINQAMRSAVGHPSFFGHGGTGRTIAGIIGDALLTGTGHATVYGPMMQHLQDQAYQMRLKQAEDDKPFHVNDADGNVVQIDPRKGTSSIVYHGAPHLTGIAAEIADLKNAGATDADIRTFIGNKVDPIHMAAQTDAVSGQTTLTPYRSSQFGQPPAGPPATLSTLPPGSVPVGGPSPTRSGTFPRPPRVPRRPAN